MKTNTIIFCGYLTLLATMLPMNVQGQAETEEVQSTGGGRAPSPSFIYPNPVIPLPKNQDNANDAENIKKMPQLTEEQKQCMVSFVNKGMSTCLEDIGNSYVTDKINVRPKCCAALDQLDDPCSLAIHFQNKKFEYLVTEYCASNGPAAGPGSADGPSSDGGYGDGSYPDMTGQLDGFGSAFAPSEGPSPYGSYDASYGPGSADGPSGGYSEGQVGAVIEGHEISSPTSG